MHTDQMKYFLTTVACLSMTEAAEKLNLTQSALSRSISSMESELGVRLFIRDKRKKLRLTAEGAEVYRHLATIYHDYVQMITEVDNTRRGLTGQLSVGFLEGQMLDGSFKEIVDLFLGKHPGIRLNFTRDTETGLIRQLQEGSLDVAVMLELQVRDKQDIIFSELFWLPTYMIASKDHPLAGRERVALSELRNDTFIYTTENEITQEMIRHCREAGFEPDIRYVKDIEEQSLYLELGMGIAGYNAYHSCFYSPNVATFHVDEIPDAQFVMAWNKNNFNPAIAMLNHVADTAFDR